MSDLIRWERGKPGTTHQLGYVGTHEPWAFQIHEFRDRWALRMQVAGHPGILADSDDPEALKPRAEELLREFAASLGAVFREPDGEHPLTSRCECGGLARHMEKCQWRQGYGSVVISEQSGAGS